MGLAMTPFGQTRPSDRAPHVAVPAAAWGFFLPERPIIVIEVRPEVKEFLPLCDAFFHDVNPG
jgi:hypothetical protein